MRRHLLIAAGLLALLSPAKAADSTVTALSAASALGGTELFYVVQGGADRKATPAQVDTYVRSLMGTGVSAWLNTPSSANLATAVTDETGSGSLVFATSPTLVTPALGTPSALVGTNITGTAAGLTAGNVTTNANLTGMVTSVGNATSLGSFTSANLAGALTNETGSGLAVFGTLPDFTTGVTVGGAAASGTYLRGDGTKFAGSAIQAADLPALTVTTRVETGTNPALPSSDQAKVVYLNNAANQVPTIAQATGSFGAGWFATYCNIGAGTQTITPTTSTIGGAATLLLPAGSASRPQCSNIISDGTNYLLVPQSGTVFSGTLALATGAISSATCTSAQTVTAPGVLTTDTVLASFNGDPTAVTGYIPLTAGMLTIIAYPTANTFNVKVCNNTSSSITPGAITLNVKVLR